MKQRREPQPVPTPREKRGLSKESDMKDYKHGGPKAPKIPEGALKGLGKGMNEKDVRRGYSKPK